MFCTKCGFNMADGTSVCPQCGASTAPQPQPQAQGAPQSGYAPGAQPQGGYAPGAQPQGGYAPGAQPQGGYAPGGQPQGGYAPGAQPQGGYAPRSAPKQTPPIFACLIGHFKTLLATRDAAATVAATARDTSYSGALVLGAGVLITALASMLNFNQAIVHVAGGGSGISKLFPSGISFLMSLIMAIAVSAATVGTVVIASGRMLGRRLSLPAAINIVAYSSVPMLGAFILNMLLGLIWFPLVLVSTLVSTAATVLLLYASTVSLSDEKKPHWGAAAIAAACVLTVALLFIYLWLNTSLNTISGNVLGFFR